MAQIKSSMRTCWSPSLTVSLIKTTTILNNKKKKKKEKERWKEREGEGEGREQTNEFEVDKKIYVPRYVWKNPLRQWLKIRPVTSPDKAQRVAYAKVLLYIYIYITQNNRIYIFSR